MRNFVHKYLILLIAVVCCASCSTDQFLVKKNHHLRIEIEEQPTAEIEKPTVLSTFNSIQDSVKTSRIAEKDFPSHSQIKPKQNFLQKTLVIFYPNQAKLLDRVFQHPKRNLGIADTTANDRTTGLIINLMALAFGIAAVLMVIGMVHGNLWVYFVVGMVLAAAAIIMGFIGKMLSWKAFGWLAGAIGILAVVLLLIFLLLVGVVHVVF